MITEAIIVNVCSAIVLGTGIVKNWKLSRGHLLPVYWLNIVMGCAGTILNIGVVAAMPSMWGILSFCGLNVWVVWAAVLGLLRLRREKKQGEKIHEFFSEDVDYTDVWEGEVYLCRWVDDAYVCYCDYLPCPYFQEE
jgi:uncharacterized membrane protein